LPSGKVLVAVPGDHIFVTKDFIFKAYYVSTFEFLYKMLLYYFNTIILVLKYDHKYDFVVQICQIREEKFLTLFLG